MIAKKYVHRIFEFTRDTMFVKKIALTPTGENHTRKTFSQSEIVKLEIYLTLVISIFCIHMHTQIMHYTLTMHLYYVLCHLSDFDMVILSSYCRYMKCPTLHTVLFFKCIIQVFKVLFFHISLCADPLVDEYSSISLFKSLCFLLFFADTL